MILDIVASLIVAYWMLQGARLAVMNWAGPYHPFWAVLQAGVSLLLLIPLLAIWI